MWKRWILVLWLLSVSPLLAESFRYPVGKIADKASLEYVGKIPVLHVTGTAAEMGNAVGKLAVKPADRVLNYPKELCKLRGVDHLWWLFLGAGKTMYRAFPSQYHDELEAIITSAKVDRNLAIAGNTFFDIKKIFACSAVVVEKERSSTGGPLLARNLDYPSLGYIHEYSLVSIYSPKGKFAFASVGFPGLVGVLSGMNEKGLSLGVLEVFDIKSGEPHYDGKGIPYALCLRQVLEKASTIEEAVKVLEKLKRTTTINVAIADRNNVAILEISPKKVVRRKPQACVCTTTNHFLSSELRAEKAANITRTFDRLKRLDELCKTEKKLSPEDLHKNLHAVNLGTLTLQTMIFEPSTLSLHLAIGEIPASKGKFTRIDLGKRFRAVSQTRR